MNIDPKYNNLEKCNFLQHVKTFSLKILNTKIERKPFICLFEYTHPPYLSPYLSWWAAGIISVPPLLKQEQTVTQRATKQHSKAIPTGMGLFWSHINHISDFSLVRLVFLMKRYEADLTNEDCLNWLWYYTKVDFFIILGYLKAFTLLWISCIPASALAVCSEAYFSAVAKMGDQALHTLSSRSLGKFVCIVYVWLFRQPFENRFGT